MRINVPWGFIAGKWYGSQNVRPILLVHGWQDNSGSFDTLIPLLPSKFSYLAIDLPGHGFSSHLPPGCYYHAVDFIPILEIIRQNFKWKRLSFVSHSVGSILSFNYSSLQPEKVNLVCALDTLKTFSFGPTVENNFFEGQTQKLLTLDENLIRNPPEYSYEELVQRVHDSSKKSINLDKAKYIVDRGSKPSQSNPNKFYFSRDIRVKFIQLHFADHNIGLEYIKRIQAPYLFIRGDDRDFTEPPKKIAETVEVFQKHNSRFEMLKVSGTHHFHLNQPETIADKIGRFLQKYHDERN